MPNGLTDAREARPTATLRVDGDGMSSWSDALLVVVALAYAGFVGVLSVVNAVPLTPDVMLVAVGFAVVLLTRTRIDLLREWTPFVVLFLAYELMRGLADDAGLPVHVADVVAVERALFGGVLPTAILQSWLRPETGPDVLALIGSVVYLLHFLLPIATGLILWRLRRALFHPYLVALILLSFAGFATYLLLPVAPPWLAAEMGELGTAPGEPSVAYLKPDALTAIISALGLPGQATYELAFTAINANPVAAFPSLHAAYPFLTFLVIRRAFGRWGWLALAYAAFVSLTIVYTADHYVIDVLAGVVYASAAYGLMWWLVRRRGRDRVATTSPAAAD